MAAIQSGTRGAPRPPTNTFSAAARRIRHEFGTVLVIGDDVHAEPESQMYILDSSKVAARLGRVSLQILFFAKVAVTDSCIERSHEGRIILSWFSAAGAVQVCDLA